MQKNVMLIATMMTVMLLSACASVVTPNVQQKASALRPGNYILDETHAAIVFKIDHLGFSNYLGRFEKFSATLNFDEDDPTASQISTIIDMTSLDIANDDFAQTLIGPDWFDAAQFPQASFNSTSISVTGENTGTMTGDLILHGVSNPVTLDVTFNGGARDLLRGAYVVGFSAQGTIDRTAFGVSRFAGVISNEVTIEIEAEFIRQ